ncbi:hypothetical protein CHS0354_017377 [Potamilus streckersoni]|uniref:Uncharacterized protein n=1 Tax=Potamilus streckersoni TaxID=2493646 RepID=A0AAE0W694_9BIVA|nr:hypothetical protein CHS0354_017377 [Potamilus streckersoni]
MASSWSVVVYWIKENNWSILKETCTKEGSLTKGSVVQAYYLRKVYPPILIPISENKSSIERIEVQFKKFLLGVDPHVHEEQERIKKRG